MQCLCIRAPFFCLWTLEPCPFSHSSLYIALYNLLFFVPAVHKRGESNDNNHDKKALNAKDMQKHASLCELALRNTQNHILLTTGMYLINYH